MIIIHLSFTLQIKEGAMKKIEKLSISTVLLITFMACSAITVNIADAAVTESDCRFCHEDPLKVDDADISGRHHELYNQEIPDPTEVPFGVSGEPYECLSCHEQLWDPDLGVIVFIVEKDCLVCHIPKDISKATVRDGRITIDGSGFALVTNSNLVYVDKADGSGLTCQTDIVSWTDRTIEADSWLSPDGTVCAERGDTVVVPCAAAEQRISGKDSGTKPPKPCKGKKCD
jgi:hypothetical protein